MLPHPSVPAAPDAVPLAVAEVEAFDAPDTLTMDERCVWMELAPHAFKGRTLNRGTSLAFCLLCQNVVLERRFRASVRDCGGPSHRGLMQRVQADLSAFAIRPFGKPIYEAEPEAAVPANPLAKFLKRG